MASKKQLQKKLARLEFIYDQLESEIHDVNQLLKSVGFPKGLDSAKAVALELLETESEEINDS